MGILEQFGCRIRELRKSKGYSQEKFALKIGIDRTYYSSIEQGKHSLTLEKIDVIAKGLEITLEELFKGIV